MFATLIIELCLTLLENRDSPSTTAVNTSVVLVTQADMRLPLMVTGHWFMLLVSRSSEHEKLDPHLLTATLCILYARAS
jgi:hypothetical protein